MQAPWWWSKTETCRSDIYVYFNVNFNVFFKIKTCICWWVNSTVRSTAKFCLYTTMKLEQASSATEIKKGFFINASIIFVTKYLEYQFLEKLIVVQLTENFPAFCKTRYITPWPQDPICPPHSATAQPNYTFPYLVPLRKILILSSYLWLGFQNRGFCSRFQKN